MTRFARAHGSKASNERQPEEATPWSAFKQQLITQSAPRSQDEGCSPSNNSEPSYLQKKVNTETQWAAFDDDTKMKSIVKKKKFKDSMNKTSGKKSLEGLRVKNIKATSLAGNSNSKNEKCISKVAKKKKTNKSAEVEFAIHSDAKVDNPEKRLKVLKQQKLGKKANFIQKHVDNAAFESPKKFPDASSTDIGEVGKFINSKQKKKQHKRKRSLSKTQENCEIGRNDRSTSILNDCKSSESCHDDNQISTERVKHNKEKKNKRKKRKEEESDSIPTQLVNKVVTDNTNEQSNITLGKKTKRQKRNLKKLSSVSQVKKHRRKKLMQTSTMMINGEEINVTMFDGFPVRAEDAERLQELRKQLIARGLPSADIGRTLKLERRKSEKALAREKRKVCFHCRKGGHNLSDCPELNEGANQDASPTGICFKCGSTEHTHFQCRVVRGQEFRFAKCFVCQEQGHISRQCPDNPRGLYPKGGACKICGDVTHLKKDCPDLQEKKEGNTITLGTVQGDNLEALDEELKRDHQSTLNTPKKKIIKF